MKLGALLKWGHFNKRRSIFNGKEVWQMGAQEVVLIKVRRFIYSSRKRKKFVQKFDRITKKLLKMIFELK
jgi:hypothetical protein